jgi:20S proteasome subunit alpha 1
VTHLFKLTESIGCVTTGLLPDSKALVNKARQMAAEFEFDNGYPIPAHYLAKKIADDNQIYTQAAYKRASAVVMILGA